MPAIRRTKIVGRVTWLGMRPANPVDPDGIRSVAHQKLVLGFGGPLGETHAGQTRPSCVRVRHLYPEKTEINNTRQMSIVSSEELGKIASMLGIAEIDPVWLGASMVVEGIDDFSHVPPSSRLVSDSGVGLTIDMENQPCVWPGKEIEMEHPGKGGDFSRAALGMRGVTASVERPGSLQLGDRLTLFVPTQPAWTGEVGVGE